MASKKKEYEKQNLGFKPLKRFIKLLELDKKAVFFIYIYAIFAGIIKLSLPLGIQAIVNFIQGGQVSTSWAILVFIVIVSVAFTGGLQIMQLVLTENLQQRIFARSAFDFAYRIPRFSLRAVYPHYMPELVNRFFDTISIQKGLSKILIDMSTAGLQMIFGLVLLSFYHPFFVTYGLILVFILILMFRFLWTRGLNASLEESGHKYDVAYWLEEIGRTMITFKLAGKSVLPLEKTDNYVTDYLLARKDHFKVLLMQYGFSVFFNVIVVAGLLILGGLLVIKQQMNIGQFVAADIVIILVMASTEKLILSLETIYDVVTSLEKIGNVTDMKLEKSSGVEFDKIDTGKGMSISVDNLYFQYPDQNLPTLKGITLSIAEGEKVCVSGFNEAGKTTLIQLIAGLYSKFQGNIAYNDIPLGNLNFESLREMIGDSLSQEDIFKGTLMENITMGRESITYKEVMWVVQQLELTDYIKSLPKGLQTELDPGGRKISSSIKRKIILARGTVIKPRLLLLEDPMVFLERDIRDKIIQFLTGNENSWTLIGVSNDSRFAKSCDRVIVLKEGKIIGEGEWEALKQFDWFDKIFYS